MKKQKNPLAGRNETTVNGVKVIEPIITYEGSIVRGDEESLEENTKRIIKKMAEVYQEMQNKKQSEK